MARAVDGDPEFGKPIEHNHDEKPRDRGLSSVLQTATCGAIKASTAEIALPESIYTAAILFPIFQTSEERSACRRFFLNFQVIGALFATTFVQMVLCYYVRTIYKAAEYEHGKCGHRKTIWWVRNLCILVYTGYCIVDIFETFEIAQFVQRLPTTRKFKTYAPEEQDEVRSDTSIWDKEEETNKLNSFARVEVTNLYKLMVYIFVLVPKFAVSVLLLLYGSGFVVTTKENSDLILNALALGFILELDEMIYEYVMTANQKEFLSDLPKLKIHVLSVFTDFGIIIKMGCLVFLTNIQMNDFC